MKKLLSMLLMAAVALSATSCDSTSDDDITVDHSTTASPTITYIGTNIVKLGSTTTYTGTDTTSTLVTDVDNSCATLTLTGVKFAAAMPVSLDIVFSDVAETSVSGVYEAEEIIPTAADGDPYTYVTTSNLVITVVDETIVVTFDCVYSESTYAVTYVGSVSGEGLDELMPEEDEEDEEQTEPEVETDPEPEVDPEPETDSEGFYITTSSGEVLLEDATVTYYEGDNTLVVYNFSFSASLAGTTLPIVGVMESTTDGVTTLMADELEVSYTFMYTPTTGSVTYLNCEIVDGKAEMSFTISASMGGSGTATDYPCTFNGDITVEEGSYATEE